MLDTRSPIERMIDEACGVPRDFRGTPVGSLVPKSRGRGLKRGPVVKRFMGLTASPEEVYARVLKFIDERREESNG